MKRSTAELAASTLNGTVPRKVHEAVCALHSNMHPFMLLALQLRKIIKVAVLVASAGLAREE